MLARSSMKLRFTSSGLAELLLNLPARNSLELRGECENLMEF